MIPTPSTPCPICNRLPKLHKMQTRERGEEWSASCVGPKHCVSIHRQDTPESAVEEWDRRLAAEGQAMSTLKRAIEETGTG